MSFCTLMRKILRHMHSTRQDKGQGKDEGKG
jgi:hypothetical protein